MGYEYSLPSMSRPWEIKKNIILTPQNNGMYSILHKTNLSTCGENLTFAYMKITQLEAPLLYVS